MNKLSEKQITVVGMGYVGLSIATLLSQNHCVKAMDIVPEKIADDVTALLKK